MNKSDTKHRCIKIAIIDSQKIVKSILKYYLNSIHNFDVILDCESSESFLTNVNSRHLPDILIIDVTLKDIPGHDFIQNLESTYPQIKTIVLSKIDNARTILRMLKSGAKGYVTKDAGINELIKAINDVFNKGIYSNPRVSKITCEALKNPDLYTFTDREKKFLNLCCSELSYKQISERMFVSVRTIHGYRDVLCKKIGVHTRIGLTLFAIEHNYDA